MHFTHKRTTSYAYTNYVSFVSGYLFILFVKSYTSVKNIINFRIFNGDFHKWILDVIFSIFNNNELHIKNRFRSFVCSSPRNNFHIY